MVGIAWMGILMNILGGLMGGQGEGSGAGIGPPRQQPNVDPNQFPLQFPSNYQSSLGPMRSQGQGRASPLAGLQSESFRYPMASGGDKREGGALGALAGMLGGRGVQDSMWLQNMREKPGGVGSGNVIFMPSDLSKKEQRLQALRGLIAPTAGMLSNMMKKKQ